MDPDIQMGRLSVLFGLCSLAVLTEGMSAGSLVTTETARNDVHDAVEKSTESHRADLTKPKNTENSSDCPWADRAKHASQVGEEATEDSSHSNKVSNASAIVDRIEDTKRIGYYEDDVTQRSVRPQVPAVDLSSHDILLDPGLISARLTRQAAENDASYSNPTSVEDTSGDAGDVESDGSDDSDVEDDLGLAEDRYRSGYPYWYQRQFSNQRDRADNRRDPPYRNYLRYPVFPGR